jgi:hypothetical protein
MITLGTGGATILPFAGETKIICTLSADMVVAKMIIKNLGVRESGRTIEPLTIVGLGV